MYKIAIFVSGNGSNLVAIKNKIDDGTIEAEIVAVVSNKPECNAVIFAKNVSVPVYLVDCCKSEDISIDYKQLAEILLKEGISLIVLAGYLRKIPGNFINLFSNRIINIHPALLPSFGGKGMYGMNVHRAVFDSSVQISGPTVHFVDEVYDNGRIIAQKVVDISDVKSAEEIKDRVLDVEHVLLPEVVKKFSEGKVKIQGNRVYLD